MNTLSDTVLLAWGVGVCVVVLAILLHTRPAHRSRRVRPRRPRRAAPRRSSPAVTWSRLCGAGLLLFACILFALAVFDLATHRLQGLQRFYLLLPPIVFFYVAGGYLVIGMPLRIRILEDLRDNFRRRSRIALRRRKSDLDRAQERDLAFASEVGRHISRSWQWLLDSLRRVLEHRRY